MTSQIEISQQIIEIARVESSFSTLTGKIIGIHEYIPIQQRKNLMEVALLNHREGGIETGGNMNLFYFGQVNFVVLEQDKLTWDANDIAIVPSMQIVSGYVSAFTALFKSHENSSLQDLSLSNGGKVQHIRILDPVEYAPATRNDNYTQQASIPIEVHTKEPTA